MFQTPENLEKEAQLNIIQNYIYQIPTLLIKNIPSNSIQEFLNFNVEFVRIKPKKQIQFNLVDSIKNKYDIVLEYNEEVYESDLINGNRIKTIQLTYKQQYPIESYIFAFNSFNIYPLYVENNKGKIKNKVKGIFLLSLKVFFY